MKQNMLLSFVIGVTCLLLGLSSCEGEDKSVFGDDFEIPELTDDNTIQFTVNTTGWKQVSVIGGGGKMAIEWGDGRLQKIANADRETITYQYGNKKTYRVRIWAEDLDFCSLGSELILLSNLRMGYFPKMKHLGINGFVDTPDLNIGACFPNLEAANIGNCSDLEQLDFSGCAELQFIEVYTHPKLASLTLENHPKLACLRCNYNDGLTALSLKNLPALTQLGCYNNPLLSGINMDARMEITELDMGDCAFRSMDFLSKLPLLTILNCNSNQIEKLDLSTHLHLNGLSCFGNKKLTDLKMPKGTQWLNYVYIYSCNLDAAMLNSVFDELMTVFPSVVGRPIGRIAYYDNPGANTCNSKALVDKGWDIAKEPIGTN